MIIEIDNKLTSKIEEYCHINGIEDINNFALNCLKEGFNITMFGVSPIDNKKRETNGIIAQNTIETESIEETKTEVKPKKSPSKSRKIKIIEKK